MKAVGGVIALGAVGTVLQGCGGGEAPVKVACFNNQMNLVSQSIEATSVTKVEMSANGTTSNIEVTGTSKEQMDMENFNFFLEVDGTTVMTAGAMKDDTKSWSRMVINADKKEVIKWSKVTLATMNVSMSECTILPMPFPPKEQLKEMYAAYLPLLQKNMTCTGNDGNYDTFHGEVDTSMQQNSLQLVTDIQMDKDYLMRGTSTMTGAMTMTGESGGLNVKYEYTETATKAKAGGPSSDDLDWSKWGVECKKAPTPPGPDGPGPGAMVKLALDAKKFKPGNLHFFSQFMNTPAAAHEKSKVVVV